MLTGAATVGEEEQQGEDPGEAAMDFIATMELSLQDRLIGYDTLATWEQ